MKLKPDAKLHLVILGCVFPLYSHAQSSAKVTKDKIKQEEKDEVPGNLEIKKENQDVIKERKGGTHSSQQKERQSSAHVGSSASARP